jgi:hypothetical protein
MGKYAIKYAEDGLLNLIDENGNPQLYRNYNAIMDEDKNFYRVLYYDKECDKMKENLLNKETLEPLFDDWCYCIYSFHGKYAIVSRNHHKLSNGFSYEEYNIIDEDGNIVFNEWFNGTIHGPYEDGTYFVSKHFNIENFGNKEAVPHYDIKFNVLDSSLNLLYDEWKSPEECMDLILKYLMPTK